MGYRYESSENGQVVETPQARPDLDVLATWTRTGWADVSSISGTPEETILGGPFPTGPNVSPRQNSNNSGPNTVGEDATPEEVFVQNPAQVFDAGQAAADFDAEHGIANDGPRPNGGPSEEQYAEALARTVPEGADPLEATKREGEPAGDLDTTTKVRAQVAADFAEERAAAEPTDERPKENQSTELWAAYAAREGVELDGATKRDEIILAVKKAQQPGLSSSLEDWTAYATEKLGASEADLKDLNRDQLAQKYGA